MSALHIRAVCCKPPTAATEKEKENPVAKQEGYSWQLQSCADPPIAFFFTNNAWGASGKALKDTTTRPSQTLRRVTVSTKVKISWPRCCER